MAKLVNLSNLIFGRLGRVRAPSAKTRPTTLNRAAVEGADYNRVARLAYEAILAPADIMAVRPTGISAQTPHPGVAPQLIDSYLETQGNSIPDIGKVKKILQMPHVILEIGCGSCEVAMRIAQCNPGWGIIATDLYECPPFSDSGSHYHQVARSWKERRLAAQHLPQENLTVLKAEIEILRYLPDQIVDTLLIINPEPRVGKALLDFLFQSDLCRKIKPGDRQLMVLPYSREMGIHSCGGYEFDHGEDWSLGLGFLMASGFQFIKEQGLQWGVDLYRTSPYWGNSTQMDVYVYGNRRSPA